MNVAAIDIGTNTVLLLIAEARDGGMFPVEEHAEITRLGKGVDRTGQLSSDAIERTLAVLGTYAERIRAHQVERVGAVGTQALREAKNGSEFLARAEEILGAPIEVIAGEREAALAWRAVSSSFPLARGETRTVVDIGGGSTELLVGGERPDQLISIPIGSVRLTERLLHHDPPTDEEKRALTDEIDRALDSAPTLDGQLVGVAGTVTTLCAMALGLADYDGARVHGTRMKRSDVEAQVARLGTMVVADRKRTPGLDPRRADVIYAGGVILERILRRGNFTELIVSDRGIRWGLAAELTCSG